MKYITTKHAQTQIITMIVNLKRFDKKPMKKMNINK
jgi:hypothetical protein